MAVKSSGQLAISEIVAEFGGDAPHALSEYYGGAGLVPAGANPNVSTSGQTKFSNFYNSVAATVLNILSNTTNYNIKTAVQAAGGDLNTPVILTIASGVTVSGSNASTPAMKTDTGWGSGVTINITNNGSIVGSSGTNTSGNPSSGGGSGGQSGGANSNGQGNPNGLAGSAGASGSGSAESANNGGVAFEHSQTGDNNLSVIFDVAGTRTGGAAGIKTFTGNGGGGGGGGGSWNTYCAGGGGGGGANGGSGGGANSDTLGVGGGGGSSGSATTGGSGGGQGGTYCGVNRYNNNQGCNTYHGGGGTGGSGGNLGNAGANGGSGGSGNNCNSSGGGGSGGSGGAAGSNGTASGSTGAVLSGNTGQIS